MLTEEIFRAYDIRGIVDKTLTESIVRQIGQAIGTTILKMGGKFCIVGRDGRLSGPMLIASLKSGLQSTGCDVIDIGVVPTPVLYFASCHLNIDHAVMLTGSHNPKNYNGLKIILGGEAIYGDAILALYRLIKSGQFLQGAGVIQERSISQDYIDIVNEKVQLSRPLKVVIDCGNGVSGGLAPDLYRALGCDVVPLYCDIDGHFPNHHPDPGDPVNLVELQEAVIAHQADVGLAFDGDGDRLGVVENQGKIIWPDRVLMLFAEQVLSHCPGATIIYDVKSSYLLPEIIQRAGGQGLMWKTGHSLIKAKIKQEQAMLAGEMSGHVFFKHNWYGFDDALYAGARLLEILSHEHESSAAIFQRYPEAVSTPEIVIPVDESEKFSVISKMIKLGNFADGKVVTLDGLRVDFSYGWGLVRASNTGPKLIARFEATNQGYLQNIKTIFRELLLSVAPKLIVDF